MSNQENLQFLDDLNLGEFGLDFYGKILWNLPTLF